MVAFVAASVALSWLLPMAPEARAEGIIGQQTFMIRYPNGQLYQAVVRASDSFLLHPGTRLNVKVGDGFKERTVDVYLVRFVLNAQVVTNGGCRQMWSRMDEGSCEGPTRSYWEASLVDPLSR